jgi:hypothetical protein
MQICTLMILKQSALKISFVFLFFGTCNNFLFLMSMFDVCQYVSNVMHKYILLLLLGVRNFGET